MRKLWSIIILFVMLIACEDREVAPVTIPSWLEPRIEELEASGCAGCSITRFTYREEYFYLVYCNIWSCVDCETYHYNGEPVVWGEDVDQVDFESNKTRPIKIWECSNDSGAP